MRSMKHLLRLVGALALSSTAATSVVACGGQQKTDKEYSDAIVNQLKAGVDGASLNALKTQADALTLFQAAATKVKVGATVTLVTLGDAEKVLNSGDNTIKVKVTVGKIVVASTDAIVKDVKSATDKEYSDAIVNKLKAGVDGSSLDTSKTQAQALALFQEAATKIKDSATVTLVTPGDATKTLDRDDNTIKVKVTVGKIVVASTDAVVKGVIVSDAQNVGFIKIALEAGVDGSNLNTLNTKEDGLPLLQAAATKIKDGATVEFATPSDKDTRLTEGNNTIRVIVTVGSNAETFDAVLTGIVAH